MVIIKIFYNVSSYIQGKKNLYLAYNPKGGKWIQSYQCSFYGGKNGIQVSN